MFIRMMICIVVIAIAAPFFIPGPNGTPIMTLDMFKFEKPSISLPDINLGGGSDAASTNQALYRYQDENGVWHFTDQLPPEGEAEQIEVSDINLMEAPPPPKLVEKESTVSASPLTAITRGAEVMEEAQEVQELLDSRLEDMDQSLNDIR
jgi:hypothetical protein